MGAFFGAAWLAFAVLVAAGLEGRSLTLAGSAYLAFLLLGSVALLGRRIAQARRETEDRVRRSHAETLEKIRSVAERVDEIARTTAKLAFDPYDYWQARAKQYGRSGVGDIGKLPAFDVETAKDKASLIPFLAKHLKGSEERILDFGCGFGRFTHDLARLVSVEACGVDATPELLDIARRENAEPEKVRFELARGAIPFPDHTFDVVWVSYVLIHVIGAEKQRIASELVRVLAPGGLLFVTEGVTTWRTSSPHCEFQPFEWYEAAFGIPLEPHLRDGLRKLAKQEIPALVEARRKSDEDIHLVMVGRKP